MLTIGTKAPNFALLDQNGKERTLEEFLHQGKRIVLYFYPKDHTPGCTDEACGYNEHLDAFLAKDTLVLGLSKDSVKSHKKFEEDYGLRFTLLSDPSLEAIKAYDAWKEKKLYGKTSFGVKRTTYIIDENGIITFGNDKVKAKDDPLKMLGVL